MKNASPQSAATGVARIDAPDIRLARDRFGQLVLILADDRCPVAVVPVRAFPLSAPVQGVALVDPDGRECRWVEDLSMLAPDARALIEEELAAREFAPEIRRILAVSSSGGTLCWHVSTDRGETRFTQRAGEPVRRLAHGRLQIADENGVLYLVRDPDTLDARSRRLLERYR